MEPSALPVWAQGAALVSIALVSAIIGVFKYLKTESKAAAEPSTGAVLSASFLDSKLLKELIEALREHQDETARELKKLGRSMQELRESIIENTEASIVETDSTGNLLKFLSRRVKQQPLLTAIPEAETNE